ncbi:MAG: response regulator transcription factor [Christensenellaceae bacterium]
MIYYVEDDTNIRDLVVYTLRQSGYDACGFSEAATFWAACNKLRPVLVILDIMLPGQDGFSILQQLKRSAALADIPVIMLSAKNTEYDKVFSLEQGADDYIEKPFGLMKFIARVKAILRRNSSEKTETFLYSSGAITLDTEKYQVTNDGIPVSLTQMEFKLLQYLLMHQGTAISRDTLLSSVWGYEYHGGTRTIDVHVQTLRQKLGENSAQIETVRGIGYRMKEF